MTDPRNARHDLRAGAGGRARGMNARAVDLHAFRDPRRPLGADVRPLRVAIEALDLAELSEADRDDLARMAAALLQALHPYPADWRPSNARACPRVVAGKRCRAWSRYGERCVCEGWRLLDHARLWNTPDGRLLTAEPYHVEGAELARFVAACGELGLRVELSGGSAYFPGAALLLCVRRADAPVRFDHLTF